MPVYGLASDIAYFDLLFTHLMLQMGKNLEPKPQPGDTYMSALVRMKEAGMKWERIGHLLIEAGLMEGPYKRNVGVRFTKEYTQFCACEGRPRLRTNPATYQRSYAEGFVREVSVRFAEQREQQHQRPGGESMALALRDIRELARQMYDEECPREKRAKGTTLARDTRKTDWNAYGAGKRDGRHADISGTPQRGLRNQKELRS